MTHAKKAHADLVHTYLDLLTKEIDQALQIPEPANSWHPVTEKPAPGLYIIRTEDGHTYFQTFTPEAGWLPNVTKWMPIPE